LAKDRLHAAQGHVQLTEVHPSSCTVWR
jgi:hypothetical protein